MYLILWILFTGFKPNRCSHDEYTCNKTSNCIPMSKVCNGERDCMTADDESQALCCKYNLIFSSPWQVRGSLRYIPSIGIQTWFIIGRKLTKGFLSHSERSEAVIDKKKYHRKYKSKIPVHGRIQITSLTFDFPVWKKITNTAWFVKGFVLILRAVRLENQWLVSWVDAFSLFSAHTTRCVRSPCQHMCINYSSINRFKCSCKSGYTLDQNGFSCNGQYNVLVQNSTYR